MNFLLRNVFTAIGSCLFAVSAHALSGEPVSGQVIDESTGKPVADALVVVHWNGSWTRSTACYHVETARTDGNGKFQTSAWQTAWSPRDLFFTFYDQTVAIYKPGHLQSSNRPKSAGVFLITPFLGTKQAYFDTVLGAPSWGCERAGASGKNEYRLFKALAQEAATLAETSKQRGTAQTLAKLAEQSLVNFDKPTHYVGDSDRVQNVDPKDGFKKEEVPQ